jgi:hypothetical protein
MIRRFRIGFTGTRKELTPQQHEALERELCDLKQRYADKQLQAHHGDTIGADAAFHRMCQQLQIEVVIHLATDQSDRAYCQGAMDTLAPVDFSDQSDAIVKCTQLLVAAPDGFKEKVRGSGTWMTVRRARKAQRSIVFIYPDGVRVAEIED